MTAGDPSQPTAGREGTRGGAIPVPLLNCFRWRVAAGFSLKDGARTATLPLPWPGIAGWSMVSVQCPGNTGTIRMSLAIAGRAFDVRCEDGEMSKRIVLASHRTREVTLAPVGSAGLPQRLALTFATALPGFAASRMRAKILAAVTQRSLPVTARIAIEDLPPPRTLGEAEAWLRWYERIFTGESIPLHEADLLATGMPFHEILADLESMQEPGRSALMFLLCHHLRSRRITRPGSRPIAGPVSEPR